MKKIISVFVLICMAFQFCFTVNAANDTIFSLDLTNVPVGAYKEYNKDVKGDALLEVVADETTGEKYIRQTDNNPDVSSGFTTGGLPLDGTVTVSFKIRLIKSKANFYISSSGHTVSAILGDPIAYYQSSTNTVKSQIGVEPGGDWAEIVCVLKPSSRTFDLYKNGWKAVNNAPIRDNTSVNKTFSFMVFSAGAHLQTEFHIKDIKAHKGEVIPEITEKLILNGERNLVDYMDSEARLDAALSDVVAFSLDNSVARVNNTYVRIDENDVYVAPFKNENGCIFIPSEFAETAFGCSAAKTSSGYKFTAGSTVAAVTEGSKNATLNDTSVSLTAAPVTKHNTLFVPVDFLADAFGKTVFTDERGLVVISDEPVISDGQEDIIKPLLTELRNRATLYGNKKYSDVNITSRSYRNDGFKDAFGNAQMGTLDATKRFMATVSRWTYELNSTGNKAMRDQGLLVQGTLNANVNDGSKEICSWFLDGTPYTRADGVWGTLWGCVSDPHYVEHIRQRARNGIDAGITVWQFDDFPLNANYRYGGCFCDYCMTEFPIYLSTQVEKEKLDVAGISHPESFNYKEYLASIGVTQKEQYNTMANGTAIDALWDSFHNYRVQNFHRDLLAYMEEYAGEDIYYSFNASNTAGGITKSWIYDLVDGVMGETSGKYTTADAIMGTMLLTRALGVENVISPLPKDEESTAMMYPAIAMCYATGQYVLIPWDDWLYDDVRYYATVEELESLYELPREYPYLFDNYEVPELVGYVCDMDKLSTAVPVGTEVLSASLPARAVVSGSYLENCVVDSSDFDGLEVLVAGTDLTALSEEETNAISESRLNLVSKSDTEAYEAVKAEYSTTKCENENVYTVLRQNMLYDDAPVVVHAVSYNEGGSDDIEIEVNNRYLPEGDTFTVNVYQPGKKYETITVERGDLSTVLKAEYINKWAIFEIFGTNTVRRGASFRLGNGFNGIGMGTRISHDSASGTPDDFTITTYGEGINSKTAADNGTQDEAAFVYKRFGKGVIKSADVSAGFGEADGAYGVMIREGIYSNARFMALMYDSENGLRLAERVVTNKGISYMTLSDSKPEYMKLETDGIKFTAYTSEDGAEYKKIAEISADEKIGAYTEAIGGVFTSSPDGSRAQCEVKDLDVNCRVIELSPDKGDFENIFESTGHNYSFEGETGVYTGTVAPGAGETFTVLNPEPENFYAIDGTNVLRIEGGAGDGEERMVSLENITGLLDTYKKYEVTMWVRAATQSNAPVRLVVDGADDSFLVPVIKEETATVPNGRWKKISTVFTAAQREEATTATGNNITISLARDGSDTSVIFADYIAIREIIPPFTMSFSGITSGGVDVERGTPLKLTLSNMLKSELSPEDITIVPETEVEVQKEDDRNYYITLKNPAQATAYIISLKDLEDSYGQLVSGEFTYTTAFDGPMAADIASGMKFTSSNTNGFLHINITNDINGEVVAEKVEGVTSGTAQINYLPFENNGVYLVTGCVKNEDEEPHKSAAASFSVSHSGRSMHTYAPSLPYGSDSTLIGDKEWHEMASIIQIVPKTCPGTGDCANGCINGGTGAHAGISVNKFGSKYRIKDFMIRKLRAFGEDGSYLATVIPGEDNVATLYVFGAESNIFYATASYEGTKLVDVTSGRADIKDNELTKIDIPVGDNYKIYIWDNKMSPMCVSFSEADVR